MTSSPKIVRRVTADKYGYGRKARHLVVALEGETSSPPMNSSGARVYPARLWDVYWWMLRCQADKIRMEELLLKTRKAARLASRRQRDAERAIVSIRHMNLHRLVAHPTKSRSFTVSAVRCHRRVPS